MLYIDDAIIELFYFFFTMIIVFWLMPLTLDIIADFFNKIFRIGKKNDFEKY